MKKLLTFLIPTLFLAFIAKRQDIFYGNSSVVGIVYASIVKIYDIKDTIFCILIYKRLQRNTTEKQRILRQSDEIKAIYQGKYSNFSKI